ncbi:MAG TPA: glycosyltransferase family 1 protein [Ktedonobacterales bacterium]|jgi:glycosyltransferase involved in cell wall biosynthesis
MRIALFAETFLPHVDGIVTRLTHTLDQLARAGDEVLVVAPAARGLPTTYAGGPVVGAFSVRMPFYPDMRLGLPMPRRRLARLLTRFQPEIIHAVNPISLGLGALYFSRRRRVPLVASYHTNLASYARRYHVPMFERPGWAYIRALHNRAQLNLCTSRQMQRELTARGFQRVELWEPGVDAAQFRPDLASHEWRARLTDGHPERTIILSVGRLAQEKDLHTLAPVLPYLAGCHLSFVGDGPAARTLRGLFAGLPATFVGTLRGDDLAAAYASADVFVLPSRTETLGLVALEAMAAGLPVVGADRGGIPDLVDDGATGLLFDPDTPDALAGALTQLVDDADLRARLGAAGRMRAEGWDWARTTAGLRAQYARVLGAAERSGESVDLASTRGASGA